MLAFLGSHGRNAREDLDVLVVLIMALLGEPVGYGHGSLLLGGIGSGMRCMRICVLLMLLVLFHGK